MKKFTLYHVSEGTLFESSDTQPGQQFYLATEADEVMAGASIALNNAKARIRELEQQLAGANATIALFMGPDGEQHIERFAAAVRSLMESVTK